MEEEGFIESSISSRSDEQLTPNVDGSEINNQKSNEMDNNGVTNTKMKKTRKYRSKNNITGPKVDIKVKLERSRQSARECRARKKLRYQYLEDLVVKREGANLALKMEIEQLKKEAMKGKNAKLDEIY